MFTKAKKVEPMVILEKPKPIAKSIAKSYEELKEYYALAEAASYKPHQLTVEEFKRFLIKHDFPEFKLSEVVSFMDSKVVEARHNTRITGWCWYPLRKQDKLNASFGAAFKQYGGAELKSDYYHSNHTLYKHEIPLNVLKKVALISKEFGNKVALMASDYAVQNPDPFLLAVICDADGNGTRFVIDFWDEPGFGLEQQLKV